jgi:phenylpropionate dioxygenase-like ring-hydroxylating dioxygenase large terminal subunit
MGELMRQYWVPAALSSELAPDGDPMRLMLLGEKLIAFRDTAGKVGIMDHRCPHRCASLFFGRNEEGGIRCVYHGWKFDAEGRCTDMPNLPAHQDFKEKVRARAYPVQERNGLIWVYMGKAAKAPPLPELEATLLPPEDVQLFCIQRECNWLQALEGDIDTSHFSWLHYGAIRPEDIDPASTSKYNAINRAPEYYTTETDWGTMYGAWREAEGDETYWRVAHFMFPFWTITPESPFSHQVGHRAWVPMDDGHTMMFNVVWKGRRAHPRVDRQGNPFPGARPGGLPMQPNTTDWFGRWRPVQNAANDYLIDRDEQRNGSFTGIEGIVMQDQAVTESMGAITDHDFEHLAPSDRMITQTRRRLLSAARALRDRGEQPPASADPSVYLQARGGEFLAPQNLGWPDAYRYALQSIEDPTGRFSQAAE